MAAHGLTICKQVRNVIDTRPPEVAFDYAYGATCAPGTCFTAGFDWDIWTRIDRAVQERDMTALIDAVEDGIRLHGWMAQYATLEDVRVARTRENDTLTHAQE